MNRRTKRLPLHHLSVVLGLLLSACTGVQAAEPSAAPPTSPPATLPPTATATFTPVPPTATPTAIPPTATPSPKPNLTATAAARATETAAPILAMIDGELQKYDLSTQEGQVGWVHDPLTMKLDTYMEAHTDVDYPDLVVSDFVVHSDITWDSTTGLAGCGLLLRSGEDFSKGQQYQFALMRLAGKPLWDIEYYRYGQFQYNITGLRDAPGVNFESGSTNKVTIVVQGNKMTVYANGDKLGAGTDNKLTDGIVSFLAWQESGETTCTFTNSWLWVLK